jgi:hypothetical protein
VPGEVYLAGHRLSVSNWQTSEAGIARTLAAFETAVASQAR